MSDDLTRENPMYMLERLKGGRRHYILRIETDFDNVTHTRFAIIVVEPGYAEIVDDGYASYEAAKAAWPESK